jgi:hypothetical protein
LVGCGLIVLGVRHAHSEQEFQSSAIRASATVVDIQFERRMYSPRVAFIDRNGKPHMLRFAVGTNPPTYSRGESVSVLYLPTSPELGRIEGATEDRLAVALPFGIGLALNFCSAVLWVFRKAIFPQYRKQPEIKQARSSDGARAP